MNYKLFFISVLLYFTLMGGLLALAAHQVKKCEDFAKQDTKILSACLNI